MKKKTIIQMSVAILLLLIGGFFIGRSSTSGTLDDCRNFVVSSNKIVQLQSEISDAQNEQLEAMTNLDTTQITQKSAEIEDLSKQIQDEAPNYKTTKAGCTNK